MPRAYAYPAPHDEVNQDFSHPLLRNTSFYLLVSFVNEYRRISLEEYLTTTSEAQQKLDMAWHHLKLLKDAYANSTTEQRAKFPA